MMILMMEISGYISEKGILCGANVIMPNLSPHSVRKKYELYNNPQVLGCCVFIFIRFYAYFDFFLIFSVICWLFSNVLFSLHMLEFLIVFLL